MEVTVRSALTNEILVHLHAKPEDTIEHLQDEAAHLHGLETGRYGMKFLLPDEHSHMNVDVKTATIEQVGWSDESDVLAVIHTLEEVSVTLEQQETYFSRPPAGLWEFQKMRPKVERICKRSGCSSCAVERLIFDEACWSTIHFSGVPADAKIAEAATRELLAKGYTPMLYNAFSKRTISLQAEPFRHLGGAFVDGYIYDVFPQIESQFNVVLNCGSFHSLHKKPPETWKITIAGEADGISAAADVLRQLESRYWHEITHPGQVSEELASPAALRCSPCLTAWLSDQQLRHIKNNWNVRVYPPVDCLLKRTMVFVGSADDVCRAKAYVEREWQTLCQHERLCQRLGRDAVERWGIDDRPEDFWGEEEPEEDWMQGYLYKRR
eukprot:gnl/MRDRNA2_/MRDRNA2_91508_c0_seq1.p1 gnl/MRDRNA2_/MRDRNA2_91508_c0~~gnl/MRDRNA2_/MRDRNA2_91508_c0_seq1.p1  ORF type:complete len:381 (+),score=70.51 gnl/MRDRNA2_/MRDRNA2_91508_c0_seq1:59-1201(+)